MRNRGTQGPLHIPALPSLQGKQVYFQREGGNRAGEDGLKVADGDAHSPVVLVYVELIQALLGMIGTFSYCGRNNMGL